MKKAYLVAPLVSIAAFAAYFMYWKSESPAAARSDVGVVDIYANRDGRAEAQGEFAAGKLVLIESAPPVSWNRERQEIALSNYGIELRAPPVDVTTGSFAKYADAFNRLMRSKIIARHGRGVFDAIHREALALRAARASEQRDKPLGPTQSTPQDH